MVIRERDCRYINLPIVVVSLVNAMVWTAYAILKKDIPLFMTNVVAFSTMCVNMIFYMWALEMISTEKIAMMIQFFQVAFPESEEDNKNIGALNDEENDDQLIMERDLDMENGVLDDEGLTKAELQAKYLRHNKLTGQAAASMSVNQRPTEETRLTSQSGSSFATKSPYYYTGSLQGQEEEETKSVGGMLDGRQSN